MIKLGKPTSNNVLLGLFLIVVLLVTLIIDPDFTKDPGPYYPCSNGGCATGLGFDNERGPDIFAGKTGYREETFRNEQRRRMGLPEIDAQ